MRHAPRSIGLVIPAYTAAIHSTVYALLRLLDWLRRRNRRFLGRHEVYHNQL